MLSLTSTASDFANKAVRAKPTELYAQAPGWHPCLWGVTGLSKTRQLNIQILGAASQVALYDCLRSPPKGLTGEYIVDTPGSGVCSHPEKA
ncbi:MAG: hypothetical protein VW447_12285, partial [Limnobacter sp.]